MKNRTEILEELISFHSSTQNEITDYEAVSVVRGLFYSFAAQLEALYEELEEIKKQSYIVTAEGVYLDRLIEGPFGLKRNPEQRSSGYVVFFANSPVQDATELEIFCAILEDDGSLSGTDTATRLITSGFNSGKVFVVVKPRNSGAVEIIELENGELGYKILLGENTHYQYLVLPVAALEVGLKTNTPEGSITVISSSINGIDGVINTSDLRTDFFGESDVTADIPFSVRFTLANSIVLAPDSSYSVISTNNANYFGQDGMLGLEDERGTPWMAFYGFKNSLTGEISATRFIEDRLRLDYTEVQSKYIKLLKPIGVEEISESQSQEELPSIFKYDKLGNAYEYVLQKAFLGRSTNRVYDFSRRPRLGTETYSQSLPGQRLKNFLQDTFNAGVVVRQLQVGLDAGLVFDPDGVVDKNGFIVSSARIGGGKDKEEDVAYRIKLQKYLASLARATKSAIELGALTVDGITYAQTYRQSTTPRGTVVVLVSSPDGTVSGKKLSEVQKTLDELWKAAGIQVILKTPEKVETSLTLQVTLKSGYRKKLVNDKINFEFQKYFKSKIPGDRIGYSELISIAQGVEGVLSTWSILLGKKLTNSFFLAPGNRVKLYGGALSGYVYELMKIAFKSPFLHSNPLFPTSFFKLPLRQGDLSSPNLFRRNDSQTSGLIRDEVWENFVSEALFSANDADDFIRFVLKNKDQIFQTYEFSYELAGFITEPLDKRMVSVPTKIPLDPDYINLDSFKDFRLSDTQVPVLYTVLVDRESLPVVGIQYILEG